jgi:energy-coupling factor transport system ATP-binding protein
MNHARVAMDGSPMEVFERAQELVDMGLDIPELTRVFMCLRKMGLEVPPVYTMDQAVDALKKLKGGE